MHIEKYVKIEEALAQTVHDYRLENTANSVFREKNDRWYADGISATDPDADVKMLVRQKDLIQKRAAKYTEVFGQKPQKTAAKVWEIVVDVMDDTTAQDIYDVYGKYFKENFGAEITGIVVHRDEGKLREIEPLHRMLVSGVEFELGDDGEFYELVYECISGGYARSGAIIQKDKYEKITNYHAHISFLNIREDGTSIGTPCLVDRAQIKRLESYSKASGEKFSIEKAIKSGLFKPSVQIATKNFFKDFNKNWRKLYNLAKPNKKHFYELEKDTLSYDELLNIIGKKIAIATANPKKLEANLEQFLTAKRPAQRIPSFKYFMARLNKLAYSNEPLEAVELKTFITQMRQSGCDARLSMFVSKHLKELAQNELEIAQNKTDNNGFFTKISYALYGKEIAELKEKNEELVAQNSTLKIDKKAHELKTELKVNKERENRLEAQKDFLSKINKMQDAIYGVLKENRSIYSKCSEIALNFNKYSLEQILKAKKLIQEQNKKLSTYIIFFDKMEHDVFCGLKEINNMTDEFFQKDLGSLYVSSKDFRR
ncbi:MAG: hypothetical protein MR582_02565 [Campylobacter sp.]|nr:hypothetical protein [Campylobacter sp.]